MRPVLHCAVLLLALAGAIRAQSEEALVRAVAGEMLRALAAHDGATLYQLILPEASIVAVMPDGSVRSLSADEFIKRSAASRERIRERIWDEQVSVRGDVASLVAPYDFFREDRRSHCGVNAFTLAKTSAGWRIGSLFFTIRESGCPASPLDGGATRRRRP